MGQVSRDVIRNQGHYDSMGWAWGQDRVPSCFRCWEVTHGLQHQPRAAAGVSPAGRAHASLCVQEMISKKKKTLTCTNMHSEKKNKNGLHVSWPGPMLFHLFLLSLELSCVFWEFKRSHPAIVLTPGLPVQLKEGPACCLVGTLLL